jgi:1-deoxy-D-xylulose-5-phosphate synthase
MKIVQIFWSIIKGYFGSGIIEFATVNRYKKSIKTLGIPDEFIEHSFL